MVVQKSSEMRGGPPAVYFTSVQTEAETGKCRVLSIPIKSDFKNIYHFQLLAISTADRAIAFIHHHKENLTCHTSAGYLI